MSSLMLQIAPHSKPDLQRKERVPSPEYEHMTTKAATISRQKSITKLVADVVAVDLNIIFSYGVSHRTSYLSLLRDACALR